MINIIKKHFLSLNRILENKLLLNTIYLIILITIFTFLVIILILKEKKKIPFLIDSKFIETIVWVFPSIIIVLISFFTIKSSLFLLPFKNFYFNLKPLILEIISMNWKWVVFLPTQKILSFNEICIPVLVPIKILLSSNSIMNTLCIPKIGTQIYSMNNCNKIINFIILKHGFCHALTSNYSGIGSVNLKLTIFSVIKKSFFYWVNNIKKSFFFGIKNYNSLIKKGHFYTKFFKIRNSKIYFSIIKKK